MANSVNVTVSPSVGSMLHKVSRQGIVVLFTRGAAVLLGIGSVFVLSRLLGPAGMGKFRSGSVVIQLLTGFCLLGLDRALSRYLPALEARGEGGSRSVLLRSGGVVVGLSLVASVVLFMVAPFLADAYFHSPDMKNVMRAFSVQLPIFALFRFLAGAAAAAKRMDVAAKVGNILAPAIFLVLLGAVAFGAIGLIGAITARAFAQLVAVACLVAFLARKYPSASHHASSSSVTLRGQLQLSIPLFVIGIGYQLLNQMDTIVLGHFVNQREVGIYSVAFKLSAFVLIGSEILLPIIAPLFSQFSETRANEMTAALFGTVTKWLCYCALLIFACLVIFRTELLGLFGKGFEGGAMVLLILGAGQLANAATGPTGLLLTMTGKQKWELANTVSLVIFNLVLNLVLVPRFGMTGAAIATGISIATINLVKLIQVKAFFGLRVYNIRFLKGLAAIGCAGAVAWSVRIWVHSFSSSPYTIMPLGGVGFVITAIFAFWLLGLDHEDKIAIAALRRRRETLDEVV